MDVCNWRAGIAQGAIGVLVAACSGGGGDSSSPSTPTTPSPPATLDTAITGVTPFPANCGDAAGTLYASAEVEPHFAIDPQNANRWIGVWQQDRWNNGGSHGVLTGVSLDAGATWSQRQIPMSTCSGGNADNGGNFQRATDPWVTFAPDGTAYQSALAFSGQSFSAISLNSILVSRSTDGGITWSNPVTVISDGADAFNDKESITADPLDARFVYVAWDRLRGNGNGPSYFARTTDAGATWEPARPIYDPGGTNQTIGNLIRVLPNGTLVNLFTELSDAAGNTVAPVIRVIRSTDRGATWSGPVTVSPLGAVGARDPVTFIGIRDGSIIPQMAVAPDGALYVVWQDARFAQARDAIAISRSTDGGLTWSTPARVNSDPSVSAFTPQVHVRADGTIGVTFFDLRGDTAEAPLVTNYWIARSADGVNWTETRVADPFNIATAPLADGGYFLGDYMGLASAGTTFVPFYVRTTGSLTNRTDVYFERVAATAAEAKATYRAEPLAQVEPDAQFRQRVSENAVRFMERRIPGWSRLRKREPQP